jgi:tetratricopeptide (TPR) repeat protein
VCILVQPMSRVLSLTLLCALTVSAQGPSDFDRYLGSAKVFVDALDYEKALSQIARAKKASRGANDDVAAELMEGLIQFELGKKEAARQAFRTGLSLNPQASLPIAGSPKARKEFEAIREEIKKSSPIQEPVVANADVPAAEQKPVTPEMTPKPQAKKIELVAPVDPPQVQPTALTFISGGVALLAGTAAVTTFLMSNHERRQAEVSYFQNDAIVNANQSNQLATASLVCTTAASAAIVTAVVSLFVNGK